MNLINPYLVVTERPDDLFAGALTLADVRDQCLGMGICVILSLSDHVYSILRVLLSLYIIYVYIYIYHVFSFSSSSYTYYLLCFCLIMFVVFPCPSCCLCSHPSSTLPLFFYHQHSQDTTTKSMTAPRGPKD